MIATLAGTVAVREANRIVVEAGGIGYEVFIPLSTYYRIPGLGERVALEIRHVVREDSITLFGFATSTEKRAFDLLMSVQHVGPKLALAILSVLAPDELAAAIAREEIDRIDAVPGVGPKVAERVVRELRDKIGDLKITAPGTLHVNGGAGKVTGSGQGHLDDAVSALVNLGVKPAEARRAAESVIAADANVAAGNLETLIRKSLTVLFGEK
ncbi:MAG TPA: Holliday junction branch migration protein RuvA [Candidatus Binataceae bacterium]|nr:Holliday junction branch migration protein RuvA [Candidatus Binataceae bacterium]